MFRSDHLKSSLGLTVIGSTLAGAFLGNLAQTFPDAIATGQVRAGMVVFESPSLYRGHHNTEVTGITELVGLLLRVGVSELGVSLILSIVSGILGVLVVALTAFVLTRQAIVALAVPIVLIWCPGWLLYSYVYPIAIFGSEHTNGVFGLLAPMLAVALLSLGYQRTGGWVMGVTPIVHLVVGTWFLGLLASVISLRIIQRKAIPGNIVRFVGLGVITSCVFFLYHAMTSEQASFFETSAETTRLWLSYIVNWDPHRQAFNPFVSESGVILIAMICIFSQRHQITMSFASHNVLPMQAFLLPVFFMATIFGVLASISHFIPVEKLPRIVVALMPGRFLNIPYFYSIIILASFLLSQSQKFSIRMLSLGGLLLVGGGRLADVLVALIYIPWWNFLVHVNEWMVDSVGYYLPFDGCWECNFPAQLFAFVLLVLLLPIVLMMKRIVFISYVIVGLIGAPIWFLTDQVLGKIGGGSGLTYNLVFILIGLLVLWVLVVALLLPLFLKKQNAFQARVKQFFSLTNYGRLVVTMVSLVALYGLTGLYIGGGSKPLSTWENNDFFAAISTGDGALLTNGPNLTKLTRRPTYLYADNLTFLPYQPALTVAANDFVSDVFNISLVPTGATNDQYYFNGPRTGGIVAKHHRTQWEARSVSDWETLMRKYKFTNIVCVSSSGFWDLQLPLLRKALIDDVYYTYY